MEKFIKQEIFFEVGDVKVEVTCYVPADEDFIINMDALANEIHRDISCDPDIKKEANNHLGI